MRGMMDSREIETAMKGGENTMLFLGGIFSAVTGAVEDVFHPVAGWLSSWATTLRIIIFERELYHQLRGTGFDENDYAEADPPE